MAQPGLPDRLVADGVRSVGVARRKTEVGQRARGQSISSWLPPRSGIRASGSCLTPPWSELPLGRSSPQFHLSETLKHYLLQTWVGGAATYSCHPPGTLRP